jgi:hypothetical protein
MAQVRHGRAEVEDLEDEQMNRDNRIGPALASGVARRAAGIENALIRQKGMRVFLDSLKGTRDRSHPWPPVVGCAPTPL